MTLTACELKAKWHDITNEGRGDAEAKVDYDACFKDAQFPPEDSSNISSDAVEAAASRLKSCMAAKGWEPVRQ